MYIFIFRFLYIFILTFTDERKIEIEPAKEIIEACKKGVNWCDGNEYEAIGL